MKWLVKLLMAVTEWTVSRLENAVASEKRTEKRLKELKEGKV